MKALYTLTCSAAMLFLSVTFCNAQEDNTEQLNMQVFNDVVKGLMEYSESLHAGRFVSHSTFSAPPRANTIEEANQLFEEHLARELDFMETLVGSGGMTIEEKEKFKIQLTSSKEQDIATYLNSFTYTNPVETFITSGQSQYLLIWEKNGEKTLYSSVIPDGMMTWTPKTPVTPQADDKAKWDLHNSLTRKQNPVFQFEFMIEDFNLLEPVTAYRVGNQSHVTLKQKSFITTPGYDELYIKYDYEKNVPLQFHIIFNNYKNKGEYIYNNYYEISGNKRFPFLIQKKLYVRNDPNQEWKMTGQMEMEIYSVDFNSQVSPDELIVPMPKGTKVLNIPEQRLVEIK